MANLPPADDAAASALGLSPADAAAVAAFRARSLQPRDASLLSWPFDHPNTGVTRFSNGSRPVFYSALERDTAEQEFAFWRLLANNALPEPVHARTFQCDVDGNVFDLRPNAASWPFLAGPSPQADYPACHALADEAVASSAQGLVSVSARNPGGATTPVFDRTILSNELVLALVQFRRAAGGGITTTQIAVP